MSAQGAGGQWLVDDVLIDGEQVDARVGSRVTGATITRAYQGASYVTLTLWDGDVQILTSGVLSRAGRPSKHQAQLQNFDQAAWKRFGDPLLVIKGQLTPWQKNWRTRLVRVDFDGTFLTLTFEDEIAALMRRREKAVKAGRRAGGATLAQGGTTRGQFLIDLIDRTTRGTPLGMGRWFVPEGSAAQPIAHDKDADKARAKGIHGHPTIAGVRADAGQLKNLETSLAIADSLQAGDRATQAMIVAGIGESGFRAIPNGSGSDYGGVFQGKVKGSDPQFSLTDTSGMATSFLKGGKGFQSGGAIAYAAANPDATPGQIALAVEGSRSNFPSQAAAEGFYQRWAVEAATILDAWGGAGKVTVTHERYEYRAGGKDHQGTQHNWYDDSVDLAQEVGGWRLFFDANRGWFVTDEWLFTRLPTFTLTRGDAGILGNPSFTADVGVPLAEIEFSVRTPLWSDAPGAVVMVDGYGPFDGRWLLSESTTDRFTGTSTVTLHRPAPKHKEPAATSRVTQQTETLPEAGSPRDRIVAAAKKALGLDATSDYLRYRQVRPMPDSLFVGKSGTPTGIYTGPILYTDCSGFATLVYKAAGIPDPNGSGYNGSGYTGTLAANGKRTSDPQPGDLAFYGSGPPWDHVGVYIGGGQVIEFGGDPGPKQLAANYRSDGPHYYTYDLGSS